MTIIAWDGQMLVGDRRRTSNGTISLITKVEKYQGELLGFAGTLATCLELKNWYKNGAVPHDFPERCKNEEEYGMLLVISPQKQIYLYADCYIPELIEEPFYAIGSGCDFARAAMHLGCHAIKAAQVACLYDSHSGSGLNYISLETDDVGTCS